MNEFLTRILALDLRALALFRICYGLTILQDLIIRAFDLQAHYTDWGLCPRYFVLENFSHPAEFSLYFLNGTAPFVAAFFLLAGFAALCMTVGYRTRLSTFVVWFHIVCVNNRNPMILDGGDILLRVILFWALFLPWGARWSVDACRSTTKEYDNHRFDMASLAYMAQVSSVYFFASTLKTDNAWKYGDAVNMALRVEQLATPLAPHLLAHPAWTQFLTFYTLAFERYGTLLLWMPPPIRFLGALLISNLHMGFGLFIHLGPFAVIGMTTPLGLWPGFVFDRWEKTRLYGWVSQQGQKLAAWWPLKGHQESAPRPLGMVTSGVLLALFSFTVTWNINLIPGGVRLWSPDKPLHFLRLDQSWNMFAPRPLTEDGWYVIVAEKINGEKVDLFRDGAPVSWEKPAHIADMYPNSRWRKFMMNIWGKDCAHWRLPYARYLTRDWNYRHQGSDQIKSFEIFFMLKENLENNQTKDLQKISLWQHRCSDEPPPAATPSPTPSP